jgi:hypothetical protein
MANNTLVPEYLDIDYNSLIASIKDELSNSDVFKDYNYEGSNIAILIELVSYIGELNTYFLNKVAKNIYMETVDIYENANRLARNEGYEPKGHISSKTTLSLEVSSVDSNGDLNYVNGDILFIPAWHKISSSKQYDTSLINFATTASKIFTASGSSISTNLPVVQGDLVTLAYTGKDIIDNEITLPTYNYAHDDDVDDTIPSMELTVNGTPWSRISDFYDEIGALTDVDTVFMMQYDKYERTKIVFSSSRSVPDDSDEIDIYLLKSLGVNGNVAAATIINPVASLVKNITNTSVGSNSDGYIGTTSLTLSNSAASIGGALPEDVEEVRENATAVHNAQYRNVTKSDYKSHLEARSDIECAHAWGEQYIAPSGDILEYNKVHISVIPPNAPSSWETGTINTSAGSWTPSGSSTTITTVVPTSYVSTYTNVIEEYLEPRKMLNAYEEWNLPELVYFSFAFSLRLHRLYELPTVSTDLLNKLIYYFRSSNQCFHTTINFMDLTEYLLDTTIISPTDNFTSVKGIRNLVLHDIDCNKRIYETNSIGNYPQYISSVYSSDVENKLRSIKIGFNQYPILSPTTVVISEEPV